MSPETARRLLQVPTTARRDDVERSFRRLARELHPDRGGDTESFRRLVQARAVLQGSGHPAGRREPVIVVHRGPWWRRLAGALLGYIQRRRDLPPPRVS